MRVSGVSTPLAKGGLCPQMDTGKIEKGPGLPQAEGHQPRGKSAAAPEKNWALSVHGRPHLPAATQGSALLLPITPTRKAPSSSSGMGVAPLPRSVSCRPEDVPFLLNHANQLPWP